MLSRYALFVPFALLVGLAACSDPGGAVDPKSATARDVEGWWLYKDEATKQSTILGLLGEPAARQQLPVDENQLVIPPGSGVSVLYERGTTSGQVFQPNYVATWSVSGGQLLESVLADRDGPSQQRFSTAIRALTPGVSMSLESSRSASGERIYRWYDRCPVTATNGWYDYIVADPACPPSITAGNGLALDADGNVHATMGVFTSSRCTRAIYAYVTKGCEPRRYTLPNFTHSAIDVRDGVVRLALVSAGAQILLFEGPVGALDFKQTVIDNGPVTAHALRFLTGAAKPTLLVGADLPAGAEAVTSYTLEGAAWAKRSGGQVPFAFASRVAPNGDVVFVRDFAIQRVRLDGTAVGQPLPLPERKAVSEPPIVREDGRVQLVYARRELGSGLGGIGGSVLGYEGVYAEWDGQRWRSVSLGLVGDVRLAPAPGGRARVMASLGKASAPAWALYELEGDRVVGAERLLGLPRGVGSTPEYHSSAQLASSPAGALAFSATGEVLGYRAASGPVERVPSTTTITFRGTGRARVVSDDGRVDCTADCAVTGLSGDRIPVRVVPEPGSAARMECVPSFNFGEDRCTVDLVVPGATFVVETAATPFERVLPLGNASGNASATRFSVAGDRVLLQADFGSSGLTFGVGSTELALSAPAPRALVGYDRAAKVGWMTALPEPALALRASPQGGGWLVIAVSGVTEVGGVRVGAANARQVLRLRVGVDGKLGDPAVVAEGPAFADLAAALGPDGSALLAFRTASTAPAQFARLGATGAATVGALGVTAPPQLVWLDGDRALVAAGPNLVALQGGAVAATRTIPGATVQAAAIQGGRALVSLALSADADFGAGARPASPYLVQYDAALNPTASVAVQVTAVALFADGAMALTVNPTTRGTAAVRYDGALAPRGTPQDLGLSNVRILASGQESGRMVLLGLQLGAAMFDGFRLTSETGRTWLLEVAR